MKNKKQDSTKVSISDYPANFHKKRKRTLTCFRPDPSKEKLNITVPQGRVTIELSRSGLLMYSFPSGFDGGLIMQVKIQHHKQIENFKNVMS